MPTEAVDLFSSRNCPVDAALMNAEDRGTDEQLWVCPACGHAERR